MGLIEGEANETTGEVLNLTLPCHELCQVEVMSGGNTISVATVLLEMGMLPQVVPGMLPSAGARYAAECWWQACC